LGPQCEVGVFDRDTDFLTSAPDVSCVLVDEAQFLSREQAVQLQRLPQARGVPVICYGLRSEFRGDPFPGSAYVRPAAGAASSSGGRLPQRRQQVSVALRQNWSRHKSGLYDCEKLGNSRLFRI
jgi:hypothetical protein